MATDAQKQRFEHMMNDVTSDTKYFPSLKVGEMIISRQRVGWELVDIVCEPGDQDNGFCKALLFFKRPYIALQKDERPGGGGGGMGS